MTTTGPAMVMMMEIEMKVVAESRDTHGEDDTDVAFRVPTRSSVPVAVDSSDAAGCT